MIIIIKMILIETPTLTTIKAKLTMIIIGITETVVTIGTIGTIETIETIGTIEIIATAGTIEIIGTIETIGTTGIIQLTTVMTITEETTETTATLMTTEISLKMCPIPTKTKAGMTVNTVTAANKTTGRDSVKMNATMEDKMISINNLKKRWKRVITILNH